MLACMTILAGTPCQYMTTYTHWLAVTAIAPQHPQQAAVVYALHCIAMHRFAVWLGALQTQSVLIAILGGHPAAPPPPLPSYHPHV
jgi:hypothetical protein